MSKYIQGENNLKAKYSVSHKKFTHNVRACELETRYEFIICKGINDGKKSVDSVSVILGGEGSLLWTKQPE